MLQITTASSLIASASFITDDVTTTCQGEISIIQITYRKYTTMHLGGYDSHLPPMHYYIRIGQGHIGVILLFIEKSIWAS